MKTLNYESSNPSGCVSVDAGIIMVGDPGYHLHKQVGAKKSYNQLPASFGTSWENFCGKFLQQDGHCLKEVELKHDVGMRGLAFIAGNFGGGGLYPVYLIKGTHRTTQLVVDFEAD